ncbi:ribonuclease HI family protein [Aminithiophilus ramosus]|uniref:Ribonuclease HI family protein n=2 Tax=Synergistales TaxID=649776 RepID=A0A9Q7A916_9BACT|nr:ribonuclease HI family protein [Aminithiophilus ramosus]QTX32686.1 ribonuclease HI family protein [Aminithiophilus ramosus]QVL36561.1 ribonuclease HI family protein [Synergistota bacterium]
MTFIGHFDGASRGNPGPAGAGAVLYDPSGREIWSAARALGNRTNNEAEYEALILLLAEADRRELKSLIVRGDSQLVVRQMKGEWKIREPRLAELAGRARNGAGAVDVTYQWVPRERNERADALSNEALDGPAKVLSAPEETVILEPVEGAIFLARGEETYAVDVAHDSCSCPAFRRRGRCRHLDAARERR